MDEDGKYCEMRLAEIQEGIKIDFDHVEKIYKELHGDDQSMKVFINDGIIFIRAKDLNELREITNYILKGEQPECDKELI